MWVSLSNDFPSFSICHEFPIYSHVSFSQGSSTTRRPQVDSTPANQLIPPTRKGLCRWLARGLCYVAIHGGFLGHGGTPIYGWFIESFVCKWVITGGTAYDLGNLQIRMNSLLPFHKTWLGPNIIQICPTKTSHRHPLIAAGSGSHSWIHVIIIPWVFRSHPVVIALSHITLYVQT